MLLGSEYVALLQLRLWTPIPDLSVSIQRMSLSLGRSWIMEGVLVVACVIVVLPQDRRRSQPAQPELYQS